MAKEKRSTLNSIAISLIMGAIIVAFLFTGVQSFTGNSNSVASIDGKKVDTSEFNRMFQTFISQREQATGKSMTQKEIRESGMQGFVLEQLISQKLMLVFAENLHFDAGTLALKDTITNQYQAFQTAGKFDITKYKNLLRANNISIQNFEEDTIDQIKLNKMNDLFESMRFSKTYIQDRIKFQNSKAKVISLSFEKEAMTKNLTVSPDKIKDFLAQSNSQAILDSLYKDYVATTPEKSQKTLDKMKSELAKKHLQKTMREELTAFNEKLKKELSMAFADENWSSVASIAKKYGLNFDKKGKEISLLNPIIPGNAIKADKLSKHFMNKDTKTIIEEENPITISFAKFDSFSMQENKANVDTLVKSASRSLQFQAVNYQREKSDIQRRLNLN